MSLSEIYAHRSTSKSLITLEMNPGAFVCLILLHMTRLFTSHLLFLFCLSAFAQDKTTDAIQELNKNEKYDKIIKDYGGKSDDFSAEALYTIGLAYYMKADDANCLKFMERSLQKNSKNPKAWYIKASTLVYMNKPEDALNGFQSAIDLDADNGDYYSGQGDAYLKLEKKDLALEAYQKACTHKIYPTGPIQ